MLGISTESGPLPVAPPLSPMLARLARELPAGGYLYEPKWDGFRCLAFRDGLEVDLRSRNDRPLARYFPELVDALVAISEPRFVLDGEIVIAHLGEFNFDALLSRLHPARSRVERLRRETPATLIVFDLLASGGDDLRDRPFVERRTELERLLSQPGPHLVATPLTDDLELATSWLDRFRGGGVDGVVAKRSDRPYRPGAREMVKVKRETTAECVVAGARLLTDRPVLSSLLLGVYDGDGVLRHVGVATQFTEERRRELLVDLEPHVVSLAGHPWEAGFLMGGSPIGRLKGAAARWSPEEMELDWVPIEPVLVCEVAYDHFDRDRLRHPARFRRWRPDRDPPSCTLEQFAALGPRAAGLISR
jgi:ATP-dependent DNA ligase